MSSCVHLSLKILEAMCMTLVVGSFNGSCKEMGVMGEGGFLLGSSNGFHSAQ